MLEAKVTASAEAAAAAARCCSAEIVHDFLLSKASNVGLFWRPLAALPTEAVEETVLPASRSEI